jgi:hypothetical protein
MSPFTRFPRPVGGRVRDPNGSVDGGGIPRIRAEAAGLTDEELQNWDAASGLPAPWATAIASSRR